MPVLSEVVGDSVADIGCGSGVYGYLMRAAWQFTGSWYWERTVAPARLIGIDWSPGTVETLRRHNPYDEVYVAGADVLPIGDRAVDTALSVENLEHLLPGEVVPALTELSRVARRRVVISTPAPWLVVNVQFLTGEIAESERDPQPMPYAEYLNLVGNLHKSSVRPEQMEAVGFDCKRNRLGAPQVHNGSIIYTADPAYVQPDRLGSIAGVPWHGYPEDDGREDWRGMYVEALQASFVMSTPRLPPARHRISAVARAIRDEMLAR
jgi:SAM-dependent methyltransferase